MTRGLVRADRRVLGGVCLGAAVLLGGTAVLTTSVRIVPTAGASVTRDPGLSSGQTLSGVATSGGASAAKDFGGWRGQSVGAVVTYTPNDSWADITKSTGEGVTGSWQGSGAHMEWSVPLIPSDGSSTLEAAAAGDYDADYAKLAAGLVAGGDGNATIRLGWEMTGGWFAWSGVKDPTAFAGAWRQAVTAMRSVSGADFTFDFNIALNTADPTPMYPGDGYVDLIGADNYDESWADSYPSTDHAQTWNGILNESFGLNWLAGFAAQHGKRLSMPEWGVASLCGGHGGGDDPDFVDHVRSWVALHDVAYEAYFEADDNSCNRFSLSSGLFPEAAGEYQKVFSQPYGASGSGAPAPVQAAPVPVPAPAPTEGLLLSFSPEHTSPIALNRTTIDRPAYIFYATADAVRKVVFELDGKGYRTETVASYDLVGSTPEGAKPFKPTLLKAGRHRISALVTLASGATTEATAVFTTGGKARSLTSQLLRLSPAASRHATVRLDRAILHRPMYLLFSKVTGYSRGTYSLDGKVVRRAKASGGTFHVKPIKTTRLSKGLHTLVLHLFKGGKVTVVRATFRVR